MEQDYQLILEQMDVPAFLTRSGCIAEINSAAAQFHLQQGQEIQPLISIGKEEYASFASGSLYLTLLLDGTAFDCSVTKLKDGDLFVLEEEPVPENLQLLALAAKQLSFPLTELSILFGKASGMDPSDQEKINRILFQLHRITNNMSDAMHLQCNLQHLESTELCSVFEEIFEKSKTLFDSTKTQIAYRLPNAPVYAPASRELLERAVYNLLSNAAKFGASNISATMTQADGKAYLTIVNDLKKPVPRQGLFTRYKRMPGLEDPRNGLGLGMTLIHAIAKAHGGTVLVETGKNTEISVTMSLSLKPLKNAVVRSPIIKPDIYGGRDRALVELSDVLPDHLYHTF